MPRLTRVANSQRTLISRMSPIRRPCADCIKHCEELTRLSNHLGIDTGVIKSASVKTRFNLAAAAGSSRYSLAGTFHMLTYAALPQQHHHSSCD
jgi:hypothetical protein